MGRDLFTFRWPLSPSGPINERYGLNRQVSVLCVSIDYTVKICHQCFVMSPLILPTDIAYRPIVPVSRHGLDFLHCICFRCNFYNPLTSPLNFFIDRDYFCKRDWKMRSVLLIVGASKTFLFLLHTIPRNLSCIKAMTIQQPQHLRAYLEKKLKCLQ